MTKSLPCSQSLTQPAAEAKELIDEVPGLIKAVEDERKQPTKPDKPITETKTITGTIKPTDDVKGYIDGRI